MKELICIVCPKGCHLQVDETTFAVTGNNCSRGAAYGAAELQNPVRVLTSTVKLTGCNARRCPVKTAGAIPKDKLFPAMKALQSVEVSAPVRVGQVILPDLLGTGVDLVAVKAFEKV